VAFILREKRRKSNINDNFVNLIVNFNNMKAKVTTKLNHANPSKMESRYIDEIRKMSPQQRFDKLMAIIEISFLLKTAKKISK
jgi:hypothetical protein